jgi:SpoVK/Ycf46/Vps4 family AAA+-type ATPase
MLDAIKIVRK